MKKMNKTARKNALTYGGVILRCPDFWFRSVTM